jgi:Asp-tRNA(Asn)/Glu-tRNA(Gln) amidotransferase A subunit family amidase
MVKTVSSPDLLRESLAGIAGKIEGREVSSAELTRLSLEAIDRRNPTLNAFIAVAGDRAMKAADAADADIAAGNYRGPLHGVPVAVKDLMAMRGTHTRAGSIVLGNKVDEEDSEGVRRLEAAGAIIAGKTHMPEFAYSPASNNQHYGTVRNPWNLNHDTGGSSSGSGSAVAAGLVFGATGSDTGGSIRMPAALCGLVGLKATFGLVSAAGAVSLSWSLDHIGPMTRTTLDAAMMLDVLAGYDPRDSRTRNVPAGGYAGAVTEGVERLRVAVLTGDGGGPLGTDAVTRGTQAGVAALEAAGALLGEIDLPELTDLGLVNSGILAIEASAYHEHFLRDRQDDLADWTRERMLAAYAYSPTAFVQLQQSRAVLREQIAAKLSGFDILALPGMPYEAPPLGVNRMNTRYTGPFNALGWPAMVVPTGLGKGGLPVSLQLVAQPWQEKLLFRAGHVVEVDGPWQGGKVAPDSNL